MINIAEQAVVDALEASEADHNKTFIVHALRSALGELLVSVLDDLSNIRIIFKNDLIQLETSQILLARIASAAERDMTDMAPTARYAADIVKE